MNNIIYAEHQGNNTADCRTDGTDSSQNNVYIHAYILLAQALSVTGSGSEPKPRPQGKPQHAIHGIVKQGSIPSKKIRDRFHPGWGAPPRGPRDNRRIAPPIVRASSRSFFARIPTFPSLSTLAVLGPVSVACRGILGMCQALHSVPGTMFLPLSRNKFNA